MYKGYKIKLKLNNRQATLALQHAGVSRHAWNWGLNLCQTLYQSNQKLPSAIDLHKRLVREVKAYNPWYYNVSKFTPQQALRDLHTAYIRFFKKTSKYPNFKKKNRHDSFYLEGNAKCPITISNNKIKLPVFGTLTLCETLPDMTIKNATISHKANHWFVAFKTPHAPSNNTPTKNPVGVDVGIKYLAVTSDNQIFPNPKPYKSHKRKLRIAQRVASKRYIKGAKSQSNRYRKAQAKTAKIHQKISNIRQDTIHKLTTDLSKNHPKITIENLNIKGIAKNRKLASAILDGGLYELRRQLEYKTKFYNSELVIADRFYPSTKRCSNCGSMKPMPLYLRTYHCDICGIAIDRDYNAAINLKQYGEVHHSCSSSVKPSPPFGGRDAMKREANSKSNFV